MTLRRLTGAAALVAAFGAPPAAARPLIGIEDERLLLQEPGAAPAAVAAWAAAGVDLVRVHARWESHAPARHATRRPSRFRPTDHTQYSWHHLDDAIALVRAAGMRVMLTVTGPGPLWASRRPQRGNRRWDPDPRAFGAFARAVATRYRHSVDTYLVWNEPNIAGWLEPQSRCARGRCRPASPHLYRALLQAALPAIKTADPGAEVVAGELAPIGREPLSSRTTLAPLPFLRGMACVDERYRRLRGGRCRGFRPVRADAIGHHPHGVHAAPDAPSADPTWAKLGDLGRLQRVLDRLTRMRRMVAPAGRRFRLHLTEFGYQTSPPDHEDGISVEQQARWLPQAAHIAWRNPRVRSLVHYQWIDEPVRWRSPSFAYAGWQSGLHYVDGTPKPAAAAFLAPFVVGADGRAWGQVRPGGAHTVTVLRDGAPAAVARTDAHGYWTARVPADPAALWRFTWGDGGTSPTVRAQR